MNDLGIFNSMAISSSAMTAEKFRMDVISNNLANAYTTRTSEGGPYQRQLVVFSSALNEAIDSGNDQEELYGVRVSEIIKDPKEGNRVYNPSHPDADDQGFVTLPNVDVVEEMVDMMTSSHSYEANLAAIQIAKKMISKALEIGRV